MGRGAVRILSLGRDGTVYAERELGQGAHGFPGTLSDWDAFGAALAPLGDLDGDGIGELAVGAPYDDGDPEEDADADPFANRGAVWILFLAADGSVRTARKISSGGGGFPDELDDDDRFGAALASVGDLDGDGREELAVGVPLDDDGGRGRGAVWILFLEADGTVRAARKLSALTGNLGFDLEDGDAFGASLAGVGDLTDDGIGELAVGAPYATRGAPRTGAVWILSLDAAGAVRFAKPIVTDQGSGIVLAAGDEFGSSLAVPGDLDRDGRRDLAVGARHHDRRRGERTDHGAVWILHLDRLCNVNSSWRIDATTPGLAEPIEEFDRFGAAVATGGDLDGNGCQELLVGADGDRGGGARRGAVHVLFLADCHPAQTMVRNGTGKNPLRLQSCSPPVMGSWWEAELDCTGFEPGMAVLLFSNAPMAKRSHRWGEILINPLPGKLMSTRLVPHAGGVVEIEVPVPDDPAYCGAELHVQGVIAVPKAKWRPTYRLVRPPPPEEGSGWTTKLDCTRYRPGVAALLLTRTPLAQRRSPPHGGVLDALLGNLLTARLVPHSGEVVELEFPIPDDLVFRGAPLHLQGVITVPKEKGRWCLTNALALLIGR